MEISIERALENIRKCIQFALSHNTDFIFIGVPSPLLALTFHKGNTSKTKYKRQINRNNTQKASHIK